MAARIPIDIRTEIYVIIPLSEMITNFKMAFQGPSEGGPIAIGFPDYAEGPQRRIGGFGGFVHSRNLIEFGLIAYLKIL